MASRERIESAPAGGWSVQLDGVGEDFTAAVRRVGLASVSRAPLRLEDSSLDDPLAFFYETLDTVQTPICTLCGRHEAVTSARHDSKSTYALAATNRSTRRNGPRDSGCRDACLSGSS
jgi:hypothetical protein